MEKAILTVISKNLHMEVCKSNSQWQCSFKDGAITKLRILDHSGLGLAGGVGVGFFGGVFWSF